jgi:hypothetical protein
MDLNSFEETKEDSLEEQMVFHYNRDERVKKAPKLVKEYYEGTFKAYRPGLFKALVQTRANRFMFFTLVVCFVVIVFLGIFNKRNEASSGLFSYNLSAFSFEETVYVSLQIDKKTGADEVNCVPAAAQIEVIYRDSSKEAVEKQLFLQQLIEPRTFLRTTLHDYDIVSVEADVLINQKTVNLKAAVEKR